MRAAAGSMRRKSIARLWRATSEMAPAISTPVGPPPTIAKVRRRWRSAAKFKSIEDRAVNEAVSLQEAAGLDIVTDGEMRRLSFQSQMTEAVDAFGPWDINAFLWGHWHGDGAGRKLTRR
jgi:hypothetical protein